MEIEEMVDQVHKNAVAKGFWQSKNIGEKIALCHSELSEALEALRCNDPENFAEELADTVIRIFDICGHLEIDIAEHIKKKHMRNLERPAMHGGKKF